MKPEDDPVDPSAEGQAWLDGLAGRGGAEPAGREGARLREALLPEKDSATGPAWAQIVAAARRPADPMHEPRAPAANQQGWSLPRLGGLAALVFAAVGIVGLMRSLHDSGEPQLRGTPSSLGAVWRTDDPLHDARRLAAQLETAGAIVTVDAAPGSVLMLRARCAPDRCAAVDAVLAPLELAVDSAGALDLSVLPRR